MVELSPSPMSGSLRFPSLVEETPSSGAYLDPPSGSRLNPLIVQDSPRQIEEDECDRWSPLAFEQGSDDEEEEIGVLEHRPLHRSPISFASSLAHTRTYVGVQESPNAYGVNAGAPLHHGGGLSSPSIHFCGGSAGAYERRQEPPMSCRGISEPTEDRASTTSLVPMRGKKDQPSLLGDSPAVRKVNNLCWGVVNSVKGGSKALPINVVSPHSTTFL